MNLLDQDKMAAAVGTALNDVFSAWLAELDERAVKEAIAGAAYTWFENHPEVVVEAIRTATLVWLDDNREMIAEELGEES